MIRASRVEGTGLRLTGGVTGTWGQPSTLPTPLQLELAYQVTTDGKATVRVRGELDIATADQAYAYLRDVVDSQDGPVTDEPVRADLLRRGRASGCSPGWPGTPGAPAIRSS